MKTMCGPKCRCQKCYEMHGSGPMVINKMTTDTPEAAKPKLTRDSYDENWNMTAFTPRTDAKTIVHFAKGQSPHYAEITLVDSAESAREILPDWQDWQGACEYDYETETDRKAKIVFLVSKLDVPLIVHECTHAALEWVANESMPYAPSGVSEEELQTYFREAVCRVVENLTREALPILLVQNYSCPAPQL